VAEVKPKREKEKSIPPAVPLATSDISPIKTEVVSATPSKVKIPKE